MTAPNLQAARQRTGELVLPRCRKRMVERDLLFRCRDTNSHERAQRPVGRTHNSFWHNKLGRFNTWHDPRLNQALNRNATKAVSLETKTLKGA
jgi:hypothetical protein